MSDDSDRSVEDPEIKLGGMDVKAENIPDLAALAIRIENAMNVDTATRLDNHLKWKRWWKNLHGWFDIGGHIIVLIAGLLNTAGLYTFANAAAEDAPKIIYIPSNGSDPVVLSTTSVDFPITFLGYPIFQILVFVSTVLAYSFQATGVFAKYCLAQSQQNEKEIQRILSDSHNGVSPTIPKPVDEEKEE